MKRGMKLSLLLHFLLILLVYFGLPSFFQKTINAERIITVDILPITSETNIRPEPPKPEEKKEEPKKEEKKEEKAPPKAEEKKEETPKEALDITKKEKLPEPKKKEEKKPEKKKDANDFDSVLTNIEKKLDKPKDPLKEIEKLLEKEDNKNKGQSNKYDASKPLSITEREAIMQQIAKCWTIPAGARDIKNMVITLRISLKEDGSVSNTTIVDRSAYERGDGFYKTAVDSAVRAVQKCSPLKNLPRDKYSNWKEIELNFDPKEMIY